MGQINPSFQGNTNGFSYGGGGETNPENAEFAPQTNNQNFNGGNANPPLAPSWGGWQSNTNSAFPQPIQYGGVPGVGGSNPAAQTYSNRPQQNGPAAPPAFGQPGWQGTFNAPGGYNPSQYADDNTANTLAGALGGTVNRTKTLGPFGDFGQNQINFGPGQDYNAGLLAERYAKYDRATADAMTAAERNMGPAVTNPNAGAVFMNQTGPTTTHTPPPAGTPAAGDPNAQYDPLSPPPGKLPLPGMPVGPNFQQPRMFRGGFGSAQNFNQWNPQGNPLVQLIGALMGFNGDFRGRSNPLGTAATPTGPVYTDPTALASLFGAGPNGAPNAAITNPVALSTAFGKGPNDANNPFGNGGSMEAFANLLNLLSQPTVVPQDTPSFTNWNDPTFRDAALKMLGNGVMDRNWSPLNPFNTQYGGTMGALNTGGGNSHYPQFQFDPSTFGISQGSDGRWNLPDGGWVLGNTRYDRNGKIISV